MITLDKPLLLQWTQYGYKVDHPNVEEAELASAEYANQLKAQRDELLEALEKIATGTHPCTEREAFIFIDITKQIAKKAIDNCK